MALKVLLLRKNLDGKEKALAELRKAAKGFESREAELEKDIEQAATEDEKTAVEEAVGEFEKEKKENEDAQKNLLDEIARIEGEIKELEQSLQTEAKPAERKGVKQVDESEERGNFFGMTAERRTAFLGRSEVKEFLQRTRELGKQRSSISGADLLIPNVVLDLIREQILKYSKLIAHVNFKHVPGKVRQTIAGTVPEAVWTEMCAKLNELKLSFNAVETDGYKVAGYIVICNSTLEDSDINLATEIISALGQAIGYALDKAILYGKGDKMPLGIVTRLAQTAKPAGYPAIAPEWKDLHTTNIQKLDGTLKESAFYSALIKAAGRAKSKYSRGQKIWIMNDTTYSDILSRSVTANMAGTFVASVGGTMPILGGKIVILDFIPDGDIAGGYMDLYLLVERAGTNLNQSEHVQFLEDNTVFRGTARYDGLPVIPNGFVLFNIYNQAPTVSLDFAADVANQSSTPAA